MNTMINKTDKKSTSFREKIFGGGKKNGAASSSELNTSVGSIGATLTNNSSSTNNNNNNGGNTSPTNGVPPSRSSTEVLPIQSSTSPLNDSSATTSTPVLSNIATSQSSSQNGLNNNNNNTQAPTASLFLNIATNTNGATTSGNTSSVKYDQELGSKLKELEATHLHYKACQNGFKSYLKESSELGRTEELMGQQMIHFSQKMDNADLNSKHLKVLTHEMGETLKQFSLYRFYLNRDIDEKYVRVLTDVQNDSQLNEAKEGNFIEAETDYQKQLRNIKYFLALLDMKNSLATYVEQCSKMLHSVEKQIDGAIKQQFETGVFNFSSLSLPTTSNANPLTPRSSGSVGTQVTLEQIISQNVPYRSDDSILFGVELRDVLKRFGEPFGIPKRMKELVEFVEQNYLETEGLFRIPGHSKGMDDLAEKVNATVDPIDYANMELTNKPHTICGLLKKYIRELPQPILTFDLYEDFINAAKIQTTSAESKQKQKEEFKKLVDKLPVENYNLLGRVCQLFFKVTQNEAKTKMNAHNISRSFGTNLMRTKVVDDQKMLGDLDKINLVCELLISYCEDLFPGDLDAKAAQGRRYTDDEIEEWKKKKSGASSSVSTVEQDSTKGPPIPLKRSQSKQFAGSEQFTDHTPKKSFTLKANENAEIQTNSSQRQSLRGWIEVLDKSRGKFYYFNPSNGETSWKHPTHGKKSAITRANEQENEQASQDVAGMQLFMELMGKVEQQDADGVTSFLKSTLLTSDNDLSRNVGEILSKDFNWDVSNLNKETNNLKKEQIELFNSKLQVLSKNFV